MRLIAAALPAELRVAKMVFDKKDTTFLHTWMWNYQTIYSLMNYLETNVDIQEIVFIGICGWTGEKNRIIQVANVINAHTWKEIILPLVQTYAPLKTILSSEVPIHSVADMNWHEYVDMESRWAALVCERKSLPLSVFRVPFDEVWSITCQAVDYQEALYTLQLWLDSLCMT